MHRLSRQRGANGPLRIVISDRGGADAILRRKLMAGAKLIIIAGKSAQLRACASLPRGSSSDVITCTFGCPGVGDRVNATVPLRRVRRGANKMKGGALGRWAF